MLNWDDDDDMDFPLEDAPLSYSLVTVPRETKLERVWRDDPYSLELYSDTEIEVMRRTWVPAEQRSQDE